MEVVRADGTTFGTVEAGHGGPLLTILGKVTVERLAHRHQGQTSLYPGDGGPSLPLLLQREAVHTADADVVVLSCGAKGVVVGPDDRRGPTAAAAARSDHKMDSRLSRGARRSRKRMAEVAAVYDVAPAVRSATDIIGPRDRSAPVPNPRDEEQVAHRQRRRRCRRVRIRHVDEAER